MKYLIVALMLVSAVCLGESKQVLQVKRINTNTVVMSCANGADPTGKEIAYHVLLISCGE